MATPLSTSLQIFIQRLESLKDWPDKNVILELTAITEQNIGFAEHFANILMARLTNEQTHASYKLPMFYVIDAIMKHVGGPFANLFSVKFSEGYTRALLDLHQKDRDKLKFLLDTWDERSFMTFDLIRKMKAMLEAPAAARPMGQPAFAHQVPVHHNAPLSTPVVPPPVYNRPKAAPVAVPTPAPAKFTPVPAVSDFRTPPADPAKQIFADLVQNEMVSMLNQMYAEMNVTNPMSLEELARANGALYAQIRGKAEESARVIIANRGVASPVVRAQPAGRYVISPTNSSISSGGVGGGVGGYDDVTGRKRAAPLVNSRYAADTYNAAPNSNYQQYSSRFNTNPPAATMPAARYAQPYTTTDRRANPINPVPTNINRDIHSAHTTGTGAAVSAEDHLQEEILSKYASDYFVNGFLCEVPVVVDVARVQALRDVLSSQYGGSSGVPKGFDAASENVVKRLSAYLNDVQVPPKLPQILFGPLPLRPIYALSAEAVEEQNIKNKAGAGGSIGTNGTIKEKVQAKLPVPPFRTEELGRNPEAHIAPLYHNRPHQFHEDGLRFATLALLTQHTDKFIQMKKLQQKKGIVREYREWFCSSAQWVTDFGVNGGASGGAVSSSSGSGSGSGGGSSAGAASSSSGSGGVNMGSSSGGGGGNDSVEYVVPADEHFTRCPVSRETFECVWDEREGEMLYRNAVKVLVTPAADAALYALAQPIPWLDGANTGGEGSVRYLIVHKMLVLDNWLSSGRAVPLPDAITRYKAITGTGTGGASGAAASGGGDGGNKAELLSRAVGEDDEEEDLFVLLEFS